MFINFIKRIDLYGKKPEFYFKGKPDKTTWIGRIITFLYILIYIGFLAYRLNRMIKRLDVKFYDTNAYTGEIPSIQLNNDIFYGAFAFNIPGTDTPYLDDRIYTISAKFVNQAKVNGQWEKNETDIIFKRCELSDFGSKYQNIFANKSISQMLCPTNLNFVLEGYETLQRYSYFKVNYKRCVNTTENNNHCYPMDVIERYLYATNINAKIQDIELVPRDYNNPIQQLEKEISGPTYKDLHLLIYVYLKLIYLETDDNIIGFESLSNTKVEKYLKYDSSWIITSPNLYGDFTVNPDADLNDITIQLSSNVLTQRRSYVQLIDVLGDVGGLMEIINMIFSVICTLIVGVLYEKSLVNNLFNFDLDKKVIYFKERKNKEKKFGYNPSNNNLLFLKNSSKILHEDTKIVDEDKNEKENNQYKNIGRRKINLKNELVYSSQSKVAFNQKDNKSLILNLDNIIDEDKNKNILNCNNTISDDIIQKKIRNKESDKFKLEKKEEFDNKNVIKKIKLDKFFVHCGFCCIRNISNVNNILLNEGMKIIIEQLDIFNIFIVLYETMRKEQELKKQVISLKMSDECKKNLAKKNK